MANETITFPVKKLQRLLSSIKNISQSAIFDISDNELDVIVSSVDKSIHLWGKIEGDFNIKKTLNIPSVPRLHDLLNLIGKDEVVFTIKNNKLEYKNGSLRFDYHLYEDGIITRSKIKKDKMKALALDHSFLFLKKDYDFLMKTSIMFKDSNRVYITTEGGELIWTLDDKTRPNIDNFSFNGGEVDFSITDPFIMRIDNLRLIEFLGNECVKFFLDKDSSVGKVEVEDGDISLVYAFSSYLER